MPAMVLAAEAMAVIVLASCGNSCARLALAEAMKMPAPTPVDIPNALGSNQPVSPKAVAIMPK